jgi:hypothetical protein
VLVNIHPLFVHRDKVEMEVKHRASYITKWEYRRSLSEALGADYFESTALCF